MHSSSENVDGKSEFAINHLIHRSVSLHHI
jgi:hypothetical protein